MQKLLPPWHPRADWSKESFFIRKLETTGPDIAGETPKSAVPLYCFLYVIEGEILITVDGGTSSCHAGHFLVIPENAPFAIRYYENSIAYAGCFSASLLSDVSYSCLHKKEPYLHAFWFEDATFIAELLQKAEEAYSRKDFGLISRIFDLILYQSNGPEAQPLHPVLNRFMDWVFDRSLPLETVAAYAEKLIITPGYLNKLSRKYTSRTAIEWIEIARINRAKSLLKNPALSIAEISAAVGIDDPSYFARFFKKQVHFSPSAFRARQMNIPEKS